MRKVMWNKLSEQAQLGTNNAEGREPGEEVMQNPGLPSSLGHLLILSENWPTMIIQGVVPPPSLDHDRGLGGCLVMRNIGPRGSNFEQMLTISFDVLN